MREMAQIQGLPEETTDMRRPLVIFVVDDEAMLRRAVGRLLRDPDYQVYYFENPVEALGQIDSLAPALIISDNMMPKMTGFDFLRKVRTERPTIRTLMLTGGYIGEEIRAAVATNEVDCLLEKPWVDATLCETVRALLAP